MSKVGVTS